MVVDKEASRMKHIKFSGIREVFDRVNELERQGEDVVHMEIGRPDFDTPVKIKQAAWKALQEGLVHYTESAGIPDLRQALSKKLKRENGLDYDPEEIIVTAGASEAIFCSFMAFLEPGDQVIVPEPMYVYYSDWPNLMGAETIPVPLSPGEGFKLDPALVEDKITGKTKMLVLNSPHNPTGKVFDKSNLRQISNLVVDHDLLVLSDEIYEYMVYDSVKHTSPASVGKMRSQSLVVNGFSKAYSMTGWRLGYLAADKDFISPLLKVRQHTSNCSCSFAQWGALEAIENCSEERKSMIQAFANRRELVINRLRSSNYFDRVDPEGAFYAFPGLRGVRMNDRELSNYLLQQAGVAVIPGSCFGKAGQGHIRLAYSNSYDQLEKGFDRIESVLDEL